MKQSCPGQCDFLVSRAGIAPGVDSGDADSVYITSLPGGLFLLPNAPVGLLFPPPLSQQPPGFILCPSWSQAIVSQVLFGA